MKTKFMISMTIALLGICVLPFVLILALPNLDVEVLVRIILASTYIFILYLIRIIQKGNHIGMITFVPGKLRDDKVASQEWLNYLFNTALIIFVPSIILLGLFQYLGISVMIDSLILAVGTVMWCGISYSKIDKKFYE